MPATRSSRDGDPPSSDPLPRTARAGHTTPPPALRGRDARYLRDARDIRALAHPARMAIIDALASGEELTATECAALTGLSPSATAYHLKFLERHSFVEPAASRSDGRDRPWRATVRGEIDIDPSTPAGAAATAAVAMAYFDSSRALATDYLATERTEPQEWRDAATLATADLWLTVEEARVLSTALAAAIEPYRDRVLGHRPEATRRVRVMNALFPHRSP